MNSADNELLPELFPRPPRYNGMCRDKHVEDFCACLIAYLGRTMGEKPYRLRSLNISGNELSDGSMERIITVLTDNMIRVDKLDLSRNKLAEQVLLVE